jgi:hypothetical protein
MKKMIVRITSDNIDVNVVEKVPSHGFVSPQTEAVQAASHDCMIAATSAESDMRHELLCQKCILHV